MRGALGDETNITEIGEKQNVGTEIYVTQRWKIGTASRRNRIGRADKGKLFWKRKKKHLRKEG